MLRLESRLLLLDLAWAQPEPDPAKRQSIGQVQLELNPLPLQLELKPRFPRIPVEDFEGVRGRMHVSQDSNRRF